MTSQKREVDANPASTPSEPAGPCKAWQQAAGQKETAARLRRLPPGVTFGDEVGEPIFYDAARHLLLYRGFMFQASYTYLHKLSTDPEYETAIDQLYLASASAYTGQGYRRLLGVVAAVAVGLAGLAAWLALR